MNNSTNYIPSLVICNLNTSTWHFHPSKVLLLILQDRILEWVAFPFSRGSSQSRDWTGVSCITGRFSIRAIKFTSKLHRARLLQSSGGISLQWILFLWEFKNKNKTEKLCSLFPVILFSRAFTPCWNLCLGSQAPWHILFTVTTICVADPRDKLMDGCGVNQESQGQLWHSQWWLLPPWKLRLQGSRPLDRHNVLS